MLPDYFCFELICLLSIHLWDGLFLKSPVSQLLRQALQFTDSTLRAAIGISFPRNQTFTLAAHDVAPERLCSAPRIAHAVFGWVFISPVRTRHYASVICDSNCAYSSRATYWFAISVRGAGHKVSSIPMWRFVAKWRCSSIFRPAFRKTDDN